MNVLQQLAGQTLDAEVVAALGRALKELGALDVPQGGVPEQEVIATDERTGAVELGPPTKA
jgi:hypothetical protein